MEFHGNIVDIEKKRIYPGTVKINNGKIISVTQRPASEIDKATETLRPYILPGFIDAHIHLEMTHVVPSQYVRAALANGTVGAVADFHDIVNVLGVKAEEKIIHNAKRIPFHFGFSAPSTITPGIYELQDIEKLLAKKQVTHLGEIQNFPDVLLHEKQVEAVIALAKKYHKPIDGCAPGLSKDRLAEYCETGISTDHQCTSYDNALEKIAHGMSVIIQMKKRDSLTPMIPLFKEHADKLMFSGQNMYAPTITHGYINTAIAEGVKDGGDLFGLLTAACITPVKQYHLDCGTLHSGDGADFVLVDSLERFNVMATFVNGKCVYSKTPEYQSVAMRCPKLKIMNRFSTTPITEDDIQVSALSANNTKASSSELKPLVNVIDVCDGEMTTVRNAFYLQEKKGHLYSDVSQDCIKVLVYDRYHANTKPVVAFVHGFAIKTGAVAMSVSHDAHNIVAVGVEDKDIVNAVNQVIRMKGGIALSVHGKVGVALQFPVAGLMSDLPLEKVNEKFADLYALYKGEMGSTLMHPIDTLSYIASNQIPSLKLSLKGLVNVVEQEVVPIVP